MRYVLAALVLQAVTTHVFAQGSQPASAAKLITNKLVCNSVQDIKDLMSMAGKGDAGIPLIVAKLRQNECRQWFAETQIIVEARSTVKDPRDDHSEAILCARRVDGDDARCLWTFPGGIQE